MLENLQWYYAEVTDNQDPKKQGSVKVLVKEIHETQPLSKWFRPLNFSSGDGHGIYYETQIGDHVKVVLQKGMQDFGGYYLPAHPRTLESGSADNITENYFAVVTKAGDKIKINKESGNITIESRTGDKYLMGNGVITIETSNGAKQIISGSRINLKPTQGSELNLGTLAKLGNTVGTINGTNTGIYDLFDLLLTGLEPLLPALILTLRPLVQLERVKNDSIFE